MTLTQIYQLDEIMAKAKKEMLNVLQWGGVTEQEALSGLIWYLEFQIPRLKDQQIIRGGK